MLLNVCVLIHYLYIRPVFSLGHVCTSAQMSCQYKFYEVCLQMCQILLNLALLTPDSESVNFERIESAVRAENKLFVYAYVCV